DSLIVCKFLRKCFTDFYGEAAEILRGVTGWDYTPAELRCTGERIHTLKKVFNIRERWAPARELDGEPWRNTAFALNHPQTFGARCWP
ncbi:MAG TPA: aldehyde ferredoxin oxidoreductase C-terminal domain-containing protein, partial [Nitrospira sp.]|nr:aldehyde ferredoxin oxidoreductase C-terminal domain-containing protein [Nitrospira sp.]